jgi:outer membrane protein assembly factor BamB
MNAIIFFSALFFTLSACHPVDPEPDILQNDALRCELLWKTSRNESGKDILSEGGFIWDDYYVVTGENYVHNGEFSLTAYNKITGKKEWYWRHPLKWQRGIDEFEIKGDIGVFSTVWGVYGMNLRNKRILWEIDFTRDKKVFGQSHIQILGNYVYTPISFGTFKSPDSLLLERVHLETGERETVYTFYKDGIWSPSVSKPVIYHNPNTQESLMIIIRQDNNDHYGPQDSPTHLVAINLRTKKLVWQKENFCEVGTQLGHSPVIYGKNVLVMGDWSTYSFDIESGELQWRKPFINLKPFGSFSNTQSLLHESKLYINPGAPDIYCLNPENGGIIWHNPKDAPNCEASMQIRDGMLIFTSWGLGSIMILDANTGKLLHRELPHDESAFHVDVVYDVQTETYFTFNYKNVMAFKIEKR